MLGTILAIWPWKARVRSRRGMLLVAVADDAGSHLPPPAEFASVPRQYCGSRRVGRGVDGDPFDGDASRTVLFGSREQRDARVAVVAGSGSVNDLWQPLTSFTGNREPDFEKIDANVVRLAPPQPDAFGFAPYGDTLVVKESAATI